MTRRAIVLAVVVLLALVGLGGWTTYRDSYQKVTLSSSNAGTVVFYVATSADNELDYNQVAPILTMPAAGTYSLKKGTYVYVASGSSRSYSSTKARMIVGSKPISFSVQLAHSQQFLNSLLASEQPAALRALDQAYPTQMQGFTPKDGKFYEDGAWYGVKLVPKSGDQDTYRAIMKKSGAVWVVATNPPALILSQPVYPDIPRDVLSDVNNF